MNGVRLTKQRREGKDQADRGIRMWKASGFRGSRATSLGMRLWSQTVGIYILASELLRQVHAFLRASVSSYHGNGNLDLIRQCRGWNRPQYWRLQYDARNPVRKPSVRVSSEIYLCNTKLFKETHQSWWRGDNEKIRFRGRLLFEGTKVIWAVGIKLPQAFSCFFLISMCQSHDGSWPFFPWLVLRLMLSAPGQLLKWN